MVLGRVVTKTAPCKVAGVGTLHRDCLVFDDFLDPGLHRALLSHALDQAAAIEPARVYQAAQSKVDRRFRAAELCVEGLGPLQGVFMERVMALFDEAIGALGIPGFPLGPIEIELVAHNDGARFGLHIDTTTQDGLAARESNRILSLVYYFHRRPKGFNGGEMELSPIGAGQPVRIEPRDNRLIAFPSYIPHQVHEVSCPSREFADSRFAVNIWLGRPRRRG